MAAPGVVAPPPHRNSKPLAIPSDVELPPDTCDNTATVLGEGEMLGDGVADADGVGTSISQMNHRTIGMVDASSFTPPPANKSQTSSRWFSTPPLSLRSVTTWLESFHCVCTKEYRSVSPRFISAPNTTSTTTTTRTAVQVGCRCSIYPAPALSSLRC
jgi:hypothetical protein